jgi:hypothetical protein
VSEFECHRHPSQLSDDVCGTCGRSFCEPCLSYLDGERALPRCNDCALVAAGIRPASSIRRAMSRRQLRRLQKARRHEGKPTPRPAFTPLAPLGPRSTAAPLEVPERDPFAWADGLDGGWSVTYRP